jgi:hypothetical protein
MAICGCGSPACWCQSAVAGGFIYADLWVELSTHLAPQALFTQSSPVRDATAKSFPLSKHTGGGDTAPAFSGLCVYLQFLWEVGLPPLLWSFPPTATFTSFPPPGCWVCATAPALSSQLVRDFPSSPLQFSGCPAVFATCLFYCYCLLFRFSFLSGWGSVCPGGYADLAQGCLWEYHVPLSSPCGPHLPKPSGRGRLAGLGALLVSPFNVKWRCYVQAGGVEGSKFCLFWVVFPVRCISSISPRFYFRRHTFCSLPLAAILESLPTFSLFIHQSMNDLVISIPWLLWIVLQ